MNPYNTSLFFKPNQVKENNFTSWLKNYKDLDSIGWYFFFVLFFFVKEKLSRMQNDAQIDTILTFLMVCWQIMHIYMMRKMIDHRESQIQYSKKIATEPQLYNFSS